MYEKKKNQLSYLGWLGLLGVFGFLINATWMKVFILFFFFFLYTNVVPDELFWRNVKNAAVKAFVVNIVFTVIVFSFCAIRANFFLQTDQFSVEVLEAMVNIDMGYFSQLMFLAGMYIIGFIITLCTFFVTLMYDRYKERKLLGEEKC